MEKSSGAMDGRCQPTPGALQRTQPVASRARPGSLQGGCLHRRQEGGSWLGCGRGGTIPLGSPLVVQRSKAPAVPGGQALPPAGVCTLMVSALDYLPCALSSPITIMPR